MGFAGVLLKYTTLSYVLLGVENILHLKVYGEQEEHWWLRAARENLELWLQAHRMAFDFLVSSLLLFPFMPMCLMDKIWSQILPGRRFHNLLIYRDFRNVGGRNLDVVQREFAPAGPPAT